MFADVTLAAEDKQVEAHKFILSTCSPFFHNILERNSHKHPLIYLKGIRYNDLLGLLDFMYCGEVNIQQKDLDSLLASAEDLQIKGLTENTNCEGSPDIILEDSSQTKYISPIRGNSLIQKSPSKTKPLPVPLEAKVQTKREIEDGTVEQFLKLISPMKDFEDQTGEDDRKKLRSRHSKRKKSHAEESGNDEERRSRKRIKKINPSGTAVQRIKTGRTQKRDESEKQETEETVRKGLERGQIFTERETVTEKENFTNSSQQTIEEADELLKLSHRVLGECSNSKTTNIKKYQSKELIQKSSKRLSPAPVRTQPSPQKNQFVNNAVTANNIPTTPSEKTKAMVSIMLQKKGSTWFCSICKQSWQLAMKSEAEVHVANAHFSDGVFVKQK